MVTIILIVVGTIVIFIVGYLLGKEYRIITIEEFNASVTRHFDSLQTTDVLPGELEKPH
jgi:hypothetical protein